jgi:hypothetical protein
MKGPTCHVGLHVGVATCHEGAYMPCRATCHVGLHVGVVNMTDRLHVGGLHAM